MMPAPPDDEAIMLAAWCGDDPERQARVGPLAATFARIRGAWPWFRLDGGFCELAGTLALGTPPDQLPALHWEDLALLDAFRRGQPQAAAVVRETIGARLVELLVHKGAEHADADDLVQDRLCDLLDNRGVTYAGRGPLVGWLRRSLLHDLGRLHEKRERRARAPWPVQVSAPLPDLESALSAHHHRPHLRLVLRDIFNGLTPEERRILRLVYSGGLTAQQVGAVVGLHRVTVQRKLGELREEIGKRTRKELARRFGLDDSTIAGLLDPERLRFETELSSILTSSAPP